MAFIVSSSASVGALAVHRQTAREAYETAMSYISQGMTGVTVKNLETNQVDGEAQIRQTVMTVRRQEDNA